RIDASIAARSAASGGRRSMRRPSPALGDGPGAATQSSSPPQAAPARALAAGSGGGRAPRWDGPGARSGDSEQDAAQERPGGRGDKDEAGARPLALPV